MNNTHLLKLKYVVGTDDSILKQAINILKQAIKHLESKGFDLVAQGELSDFEYFIISNTFKWIK